MNLGEEQISEVVRRVVAKMSNGAPAAPRSADIAEKTGECRGLGVFPTINEAVSAAKAAFRTL